MKNEKITVILPTYNRSDKLKETIKSIEDSEYPNEKIELLVIDDCSIDNTAKAIKTLRKKYKNIKYFKTDKNSGPAATRNLGVKNSTGKYLFFTDDDCVVSKNIFKVYVSFLEKNKKVMGVGGYLIPASKNIFARIELFKDKILGIDDKSIKIGKNLPVGFTCNVIYRKEVFEEFGGFNEKIKIPAGEDLEFKKVVCQKYDMASLPTKVYHNHNYNLDYILSIIMKQGMGIFPPKEQNKKVLIILKNLPYLIYNIIKKTFYYRRK